MTARFHPQPINDPFGDPGIYIEFMFEKRAILFDLGDLSALPPRKLLRVSDVFVTHMHMDHFCGFDRLLRTSLGRERTLRLYGPSGLVEAVTHKLAAYTWNLVQNYTTDLTLSVTELVSPAQQRTVEFHCRSRFRGEGERCRALAADQPLLDEQDFAVRAAILDHGIPCLAFALEETMHVNIWKNRLEQLGLGVRPWLRDLKRAITGGEPDETPIQATWKHDGHSKQRVVPLGELRHEAATITPGAKIVYVVDAAHTSANVQAITGLAKDATVLFIETPFLHEDVSRASDRNHLTARQAGEIGRQARAERIVSFHYSPRYEGRGEELKSEADDAFRGSVRTSG